MPPETNKQDSAPRRAEEPRQLAEMVRAACIEAALQGYEDAKISGLCHEGAWECAVSAIRMLDLKALLKDRSSTPTLPQ